MPTPKSRPKQSGRRPRTDSPAKVSVLIPGNLKVQLRIRAFEEGRDMGDLITDALRLYLRRYPK